MDKPNFKVGDRVEVVEGYEGLLIRDFKKGDIGKVTSLQDRGYLTADAWFCAIEADDGRNSDEHYARRFKKIKVLSNADRMRIRKAQIANG